MFLRCIWVLITSKYTSPAFITLPWILVSYTHCLLYISIWMPELNFLLSSPHLLFTQFSPSELISSSSGQNIGTILNFIVSLTSYHPFHLFLQNRSRTLVFLSSIIAINLVWTTVISVMDSCSSLLLLPLPSTVSSSHCCHKLKLPF